MEVRVRYFAAAREAAGTDAETVVVDDGSSVGHLGAALARRHPRLAAIGRGLRFAVGERFVDAAAPLREGETVALLPPVSGG